jgi:hypothetical protein
LSENAVSYSRFASSFMFCFDLQLTSTESSTWGRFDEYVSAVIYRQKQTRGHKYMQFYEYNF